MKRIIQCAISLCSILNLNAQSWTKISSNLDSLWTSSVKYYNKGDTIIYYGSTSGTGAFNAKRFYVSTDGGYRFNRDFTNLDAISLFPIVALPINNMIIGFKNTPNQGSFSFQSLNNWTSVLPLGIGIYGEVSKGTLLWNAGSGSTTLRTMGTAGENLTTVASGAQGIDLVSTYNKGTRLFLGSGTSNAIKYVDNGDFSNIQTSVIAAQGISADVVRFFESGSNLFAVVNNGNDYLYKSSDNGLNWEQVITKYDNGGNLRNLTSSFIIGTPNGNIFFLESSSGTSDNVFLSTNGGATAIKIPIGLPSNGLKHSATIGKILTNGNKVWYQVNAANTTDFVRTDTSIAGLYVFNGLVTNVEIDKTQNNSIELYPNPAQKMVTINSEKPFDRYEIVDALGQIVTEANYTSNKIALEHLQKGLYIVNLFSNNDKISKKLLVE